MNKTLETIDSTQLEMKRLLEAGPLPHLSSVLALEQTQGRGRQGNTWISKKGNLFLSIVVELEEAQLSKNVTWAPLWVGVKVRQALVDLGCKSSDLQLKWPNDLYFQNKKKCGGILCEKMGNRLIVGVGLNLIHSHQEELQREGRQTLSIAEASGLDLKPEKVRDRILENLKSSFQLDSLKKELHDVLIPRVGANVSWIDLQASALKREGVVMGLGGFGELLVSVTDVSGQHQEVQLFSEEVKEVSPSGARDQAP